MKKLFLGLLSCGSRLLNVLLGGQASLTLSARAHRDQLWLEPWIDRLLYLLAGEREHCRIHWLGEVVRAQQILASFEASANTKKTMKA